MLRPHKTSILADIHGNLPAFEAALAHARSQDSDQLSAAERAVLAA